MKKASIKLLALMLVLTSFVGCNESVQTDEIAVQVQDIIEETPTDDIIEEETPTDNIIEEETPTDDVIEEVATTDDVIEEETPTDEVIEEETPTDDVVEEETPTDEVVEEVATTQPVTTTSTNITPTTVPDAQVKSQVYATLMSNVNSTTQMTVYGTPIPSSSYMYKNMLSSTEQTLYDQIYAGLIQAQASISHTSALSSDDVYKVAQYVYNDHPELIWLNLMACSTGSGAVTPTYNGLQHSNATYNDTMATILANAKDLPTDADKIKYIHDYICYHTTFDLSYVTANDSQTAYSCLVGKRTVCAGYARAFQHCMQLLGIPTTMVNGSTTNGLHLWNLVYTNGKYYNVDVNWDDWSTDPNQYSYTYYMLSDAQLSASRAGHVRDAISSNLPKA